MLARQLVFVDGRWLSGGPSASAVWCFDRGQLFDCPNNVRNTGPPLLWRALARLEMHTSMGIATTTVVS